MIEFRKNVVVFIKHTYFWCTICGILLFFPSHNLAMSFLTLGAQSVYLALGYCGFSEILFVARFSFVWLIAFPVLLLMTYIAAFKKWNGPYIIVMCLDALFVMLAGLGELLNNNIYGFSALLPDIIISIALCIIVLGANYPINGRKAE